MSSSQNNAGDRLRAVIEGLDDQAQSVLLTLADALSVEVAESLSEKSDIVCKEFADNFRTRLQLHHAVTSEPLKKKTFEYAFQEASRAAGRKADLTSSGTHPGHDITVDGMRYSLKTEASRGIRPDRITISKFQEARWIRECETGEQFLAGCQAILDHLKHYDRILTLRAFRISGKSESIRYDLIEIPHAMLSAISSLEPKDFAERSKRSGGSSAVIRFNGKRAFRLRLDGSVEKVTLSDIQTHGCVQHASWTVPILIDSDD